MTKRALTDNQERRARDALHEMGRPLHEKYSGVSFSFLPDFGRRSVSVVINGGDSEDIRKLREDIPKTMLIDFSKSMSPLRMKTEVVTPQDKAYKKFHGGGICY